MSNTDDNIKLQRLETYARMASKDPGAIPALQALLREHLAELAESPPDVIREALRFVDDLEDPIRTVLAHELAGEIKRSDDIRVVTALYDHLHGRRQDSGMPELPPGNRAFGEVAIAVGEKALEVALRQPDLTKLRREGVSMFTNLA